MPRKKIIQLTKEQEEQAAAINEIEEMLNISSTSLSLPDMSGGPKPSNIGAKENKRKANIKKEDKAGRTGIKKKRLEKKGGLIIIKQDNIDSRSPYLVNLNSRGVFFNAEETNEQKIKKPASKFIDFLHYIYSIPELLKYKQMKMKRQVIKQTWRDSNILNDKGAKFRAMDARRREIERKVREIKSRFENEKKTFKAVTGPAGVFFKQTGNSISNFYFKHREQLDEIMVVNLVMLFGAGIWQITRAVRNFAVLIQKSFLAGFINNFLRAFYFVTGGLINKTAFFCKSAARGSWSVLKLILKDGIRVGHSIVRSSAGIFIKGTRVIKTEFAAKIEPGQEYGRKKIESISAVGSNTINSIEGGASNFFKNVGIAFSRAGFWLGRGFKFINNLSFKFLPPFSWQRHLTFFVLISLALIAPLKALSYYNIFQEIKGKVMGETEEAIESIKKAAEAGANLNFVNAADNFLRAAGSFNQARSAVVKYSNLIKLAGILPGQKAKSAAAGQSLLASGEIAASAGQHFSLALDSLQLSATDNILPLTSRLKNFSRHAKESLIELQELDNIIKGINLEAVQSLDIDNKEQIVSQLNMLDGNFSIFISGLRELIALVDVMPNFLGDEMDRRYLLIFQNNAEMRASGGFIGSYALIDFRQGQIKNIEVPGGGSYDLQGGLHQRVAAPEPLHLINSLWEFQDANWWPDWPASARKIQWFFENGWGSTVDGVIAVDPVFFEAFLKVTGEVDLTAKYGAIINSENFYDIVQAQSERKDTGVPKEIIGDLADAIIKEFPKRITGDNLLKVLDLVENSLLEKHILLYFNDAELQNFSYRHGYDGRIKQTEGDYLAVINTNISGGKSDRKIKQKVEHQAEITPDGSVIDTITITRTHTAGKGESFSGVRNVNYLRVYVPLGSELLEAGGFLSPDPIYFDKPAEGAAIDPDIHLTENISKTDEASGTKIYNEFNKTVFANWTMVDPGQEIAIRLTYKLPFKINSISQVKGPLLSILSGVEIISPYSLLAQKQSGSLETDFSSRLILPDNMEIIWGAGQAGDRNDFWLIKDSLRRDKLGAVLIKK